MREATNRDLGIALHNGDLNVLRARLDNLKQALYGQLNRLVSCHLILVVLLQEFPDRL